MAGFPRKLLSLELALKEAIKELKEDGLKKATGKSESHFRKCSDLNDQDHNIHHRDSVNIDKYCIQKGLGHPMLTAHESMLDAQAYTGINDSVSNTLINIGVRIGRLMEITHQALDPKSQSGQKLSQSEKEKISSQINDVEKKILELKLFIDKN
jgi:hypothetical protein